MKYQKIEKFTLIELLIIIAIISLLMTILLPSLTQARAQAKSAVCLSNLKNQGVFNFTFVKDNSFYFPRAKTTDNWYDNFIKYDGAQEVMFCPEAMGTPDAGSHKTPWEHLGKSSSYGMNMWVLDFRSEIDGEIVKVRSDSLYFYQTSRVDEPRVTPLMFDSAWVGTRPSSKNDESQHFAMDEVIKNPHLERAFINRLYSNLSSP